ncbi:MAG TPA: hypothetical protein VF529_21255 [Solirubrobacteraceae bacterium]|jgi:hypothetical protein
MRSAALAVVVLVVAAASAHAAGLQRVGTIRSIPVTDGDRTAAWVVRGGGWIRVGETLTGRSYRVRMPRRCRHFNGMPGGRLLMDCRRGRSDYRPQLFSARTGRELRFRGLDAVVRRERLWEGEIGRSQWAQAIGAHWIQTEWIDNDARGAAHDFFDFTNLRTGEVRPAADGAREVEDIDRPRLVRRLCSPLERPLDEPGFDPGPTPFQPFVYEPPFGVVPKWNGFTLSRCGRARPVIQAASGSFETLTRSHFAWLTVDRDRRRFLHVMNLRTRRTATWKVERFMGILTSPAFSLTRNALFLLDFRDYKKRADLTLYRGRLP